MAELREIQELVVIEGRVDFPDFETIKASAEKLVNELQVMDVTSDNVKESKRLIAQVRKQLREINDERKFVKEVIMEPYNALAVQIKEIEAIVSVGETHVVNQIKTLDGNERQAKRADIENMYDCYIKDYEARHFITFDDFIKESMLAKTCKLSKTEEALVKFLNDIDADLEVIEGLEHGNEVLVEYKQSLNLTVATRIVQNRKLSEGVAKRQRDEQAKAQGNDDNGSKISSFEVYTIEDSEKLEQFLKSNHINYKKY